jgi:hypothetical protein
MQGLEDTNSFVPLKNKNEKAKSASCKSSLEPVENIFHENWCLI